jgi:hypothetical protein
MSNNFKTVIGYSDVVDEISRRNTDKVIHSDLKEVEFDDIVMSAIHPDSDKLRDSIALNSEKLTTHTEYQIVKEAQPCAVDQLLRVAFWDEVTTASAEGRPISERAIFKGVCSNKYWIKIRDELEWKMAYILCPLMSYTRSNKLALHLGQKAIIEILNASPVVNGVFNPKIAQLQLQAYQSVQDRVYGKAVQRLQTHSTVESSKDKESIEELQREIAMLEGKKSALPMTVDVSDE